MKKLILSLVFVLATGSTFMNANTSNESAKMDCVGMAFGADPDGELTYKQFSRIVASCEASQ